MRKGTFSVKKAKANSANHNSRKYPPKYLIGLEAYTKNYYELIEKDEDFILAAQDIYQKKIGQKMQKKQIPNLILETVLTLKKEQNENTVKELFSKLHDKYGGHNLLELSVHRDEGYFNYRGFALYPNKSIVNKSDGWYIQSDPDKLVFDLKVDEEELEPVYNYHAHAKFTMFERETGRTARMNKGQMSTRIKFVSDELGLKYAPNEVTRHASKPVGMVKDEHQRKYIELRDKSKKINELKKALSESREELLSAKVKISTLRDDLDVLSYSNDSLKRDYKSICKLADKLGASQPRDVYGTVIPFDYDAHQSYKELQEAYNKLNSKYSSIAVELYQQKKSNSIKKDSLTISR
jgi:hypothetical protein